MRVEHAFAALKGRFQLLHELRLRLKKDNDLHVAIYWIMCCMILHNMVVRFEDKQREESGECGTMDWAIGVAGGSDEGTDDGNEEGGGTQGQRFRGLLMTWLFEQRGIRV